MVGVQIKASFLHSLILMIPAEKKKCDIFFTAELLDKYVFFIMPLEIILKTAYFDSSLRPSVGKPWPAPSAGLVLISAACQQHSLEGNP